MLNKGKITSFCIDAVCIIISLFFIIKQSNTFESLKAIGIWITIFSTIMLFRYKNKSTINLLVGIIILINLFLVFSVCFNTYDSAYYWQVELIKTEENIINLKNYMLFTVILLISIGNKTNEEKKENFETYNPFIAFVCLGLLGYILIFGYDRGNIGTYTLNSNTLYEYRNNSFFICMEIQ